MIPAAVRKSMPCTITHLKNKEALEALLSKVPKRNYTAVVDEFMRRLKDETYN